MKRDAKPFEPAFPKLTDPLLRNPISCSETFERRWWVHHLRGKDDLTFPVGQCGKHLDKHAPKRFRLQHSERRCFIETAWISEHVDAVCVPLLERRHIQGLVPSRHLRTQIQCLVPI